jgi:hypothetical protein
LGGRAGFSAAGGAVTALNEPEDGRPLITFVFVFEYRLSFPDKIRAYISIFD